MKMNKLLVCALVSLPLASAVGCDKKAPAAAVTTTTGAKGVGDDATVPKLAVGTATRCAVTGEEFTVKDSTVQVTYNGKRYAFCCADCQPAFSKDPAKYAKN